MLGFSCGDRSEKGKDDAAEKSESPLNSLKSDGLNRAVARLAPEQYSQLLERAFGIKIGFSDSQGTYYDLITTSFAIPLGGVDFLSHVLQRDPLTKVQTVLVARSISWVAAQIYIWQQLPLPKLHISEQNLAALLALPNTNELEKWNAHLDDVYLRLFSRYPLEEERALVRKSFDEINRIEKGNYYAAWLFVVYSLFSTTEAWHVWR
jgi:hypothetical protein